MSLPELIQKLQQAKENATSLLLQQMEPEGFWKGKLSSSALATSVAALAWHVTDDAKHKDAICNAIRWLRENVNTDGGWGDTPQSPSNLATTLLSWSCIKACCSKWVAEYADLPEKTTDAALIDLNDCAELLSRCETWLTQTVGSIEPEKMTAAVLKSYGKDKTFSVPILTHCALAGVLGENPWRHVPQLPFELAALPSTFYRFVGLPVVSYALPALIAIGMVRHVKTGGTFPLKTLRNALIPFLLKKLQALQPEGGGFLEAPPLCGFVAMSLSASGFSSNPVTENCANFLRRSQHEDGSLPIDTDLSIWLSTHAFRTLEAQEFGREQTQRFQTWLLENQMKVQHAYTGAAAGGWAWTNQPGGVPDADDTSGALIALAQTNMKNDDDLESVHKGVEWLMGVQNSDGGFPTFCKGWGTLPFDRSCTDITAHALQALYLWRESYPDIQKLNASIFRALNFLKQSQQADGSWLPLWFGSQQTPDQSNPVFGTSQVCVALQAIKPLLVSLDRMPLLKRAIDYLHSQQNEDGGWGASSGTPSTIEETALTVAALANCGIDKSTEQGVRWLMKKTKAGTIFPASAIGLYFSSLWYDEKLYPLLFSLNAFNHALACYKGAKGHVG